ncbi:MAG TPA: endonuclease NucS domain-containing protein [Tepidisphaeraceae bacterium]|nr:endonuclease NucS domain-containing protein [Tepidisphaeraceae bacterium]
MPIYDKPVRELMKHDMVRDLSIASGTVFTRDNAVDWFRRHYPRVRESTVGCHLIRLSTNARSRLHYNAKPVDDDVFYQVDSGRFRLYDRGSDPVPIGPVPSDGDDRSRDEELRDACTGSSEFAYEHDLRDYLAKNLQLIEPGLRLYEDAQEDVNGIEFPAGGRFIDILAVDKSGGYVVVELKVSRGYDRVIGQLLRYVSWIRQHHADDGQTVRGVIVSRQVTDDLRLACCDLNSISLFEYQLSVSLRPVGAK